MTERTEPFLRGKPLSADFGVCTLSLGTLVSLSAHASIQRDTNCWLDFRITDLIVSAVPLRQGINLRLLWFSR